MNILFPKWLKGGLYGVLFSLITILPALFIPYDGGFALTINPAYWISIFLHTQGVWWQYFFNQLPYLEITLFIIIPFLAGSLIVDLYQRFKKKVRISFYRIVIYFFALILISSPILIPIIKFPLQLVAPEYSLSWNRFIHHIGCDFTIKYPTSMKVMSVYSTQIVCSVELQDDDGKIIVQNVSNDPYAYVDTRFVTYPEKEEVIKINGKLARKIIKSRNNVIIILDDKSFNCFYTGQDDKVEDVFLERCENMASTYHKLQSLIF